MLLLLGGFFLLSRTFHFSGPGVILVLIGAVFLALSASRGFRGPLLPGGILLGLGAGFLMRTPLEGILPRWATIVLGLGADVAHRQAHHKRDERECRVGRDKRDEERDGEKHRVRPARLQVEQRLLGQDRRQLRMRGADGVCHFRGA